MFTISVPDGGGHDTFFAAVRAALPLDPPVPGSRSWDALSRSLYAGLRGLGAARVEIRWPDAERFAARYPEDSVPARAVLEFVAASLAADDHPVELRTVFGAVAAPPSRFAGRVERDLRAAGWLPGRQVDTAGWREQLEASGEVRMHEAAERFLGEFGGLKVDISGPGISVARVPFEFNPGDLDGEEGRFADWGAAFGISLFPLGELDRGRTFLGISEIGEVVLVETWVASFGVGDTALENLILGVRPVPRPVAMVVDRDVVQIQSLPARPRPKPPAFGVRDGEPRRPYGFAPNPW
ncbi:SUKH-3 domain-containing protein [Amycolatopsis sp. WQ 127309]|uniref:SUKH-3 domain-containing protein n=1 Tax=Amycolatopsis sp. WQ 127309 TaxID=2932773 RepID=UPI001FF60C85|nr:SUKH-3 domain-containing protein [Amycolatopsis sp. WQ 127309]UOZ11023.1 SUKH-3 domain-containing protein [Amycolatopsis sp. WQ 127309]